MGRIARRCGCIFLVTGFEASRVARCIDEMEDRISKEAGTFWLAAEIGASIAPHRAFRRNSGSSKRGRLFTAGGWAQARREASWWCDGSGFRRLDGPEILEPFESTRGALKGIMKVLATDGQISVVAAAMLGRADVWNAMVMTLHRPVTYSAAVVFLVRWWVLVESWLGREGRGREGMKNEKWRERGSVGRWRHELGGWPILGFYFSRVVHLERYQLINASKRERRWENDEEKIEKRDAARLPNAPTNAQRPRRRPRWTWTWEENV